MKKDLNSPTDYRNNLKKVLSLSWYILPFIGFINYYLITESIKAGYFDYPASAVIVAGLFPMAIVFTGIVVGSSMTLYVSKRK